MRLGRMKDRGEAQSGLAQQSPKLPSVGSNPTTPATLCQEGNWEEENLGESHFNAIRYLWKQNDDFMSGGSSMVESLPSKQPVAGSNPVLRSKVSDDQLKEWMYSPEHHKRHWALDEIFWREANGIK